VPEDVAMEQEWTSARSPEADGGTTASDTDDVTGDRVDSVGIVASHGLDDLHGHAVHMEWMSIVIIGRREDDFNGLVGRKDESVLSNVEVGGVGSTVNDFLESGGLGREVRDTVDVPLSLASGDDEVEGEGDIGILDASGDEGAEISLNKSTIVGTGGQGSGGVSLRSTRIAEDGTRKSSVLVKVVGWVATNEGSVEPVVTNTLVGIDNNIVALAGEHFHLLDGEGSSGNAISRNHGHVVVIDGDSEDVTSGLVDDAEAVALAPGDIDDSPRNFGATLEATNTVDEARVGNGNDTSGNVAVEEREGGLLPPVGNLDDSVNIINIIQGPVWVSRIVDNQRSTESIDVLHTQLGVVPESTSLAAERNFICEGRSGANRAGVDEGLGFLEDILAVEEDTVKIEGS